jgi:hypothetical protein
MFVGALAQRALTLTRGDTLCIRSLFSNVRTLGTTVERVDESFVSDLFPTALSCDKVSDMFSENIETAANIYSYEMMVTNYQSVTFFVSSIPHQHANHSHREEPVATPVLMSHLGRLIVARCRELSRFASIGESYQDDMEHRYLNLLHPGRRSLITPLSTPTMIVTSLARRPNAFRG